METCVFFKNVEDNKLGIIRPCCTLGWAGVSQRNSELQLPTDGFPSGISEVPAGMRFTDPAGGMQMFFWWECHGSQADCSHHEFESE